jgi:hypothetical protein
MVYHFNGTFLWLSFVFVQNVFVLIIHGTRLHEMRAAPEMDLLLFQ